MTNKRDYAPITYACNGATVDFPFSWKILEKESVVVTLIGEGIETILALGEDYNIDFDEVGGNVKTKTAYALGNSIIIARKASMYQDKSFSTSGGFQASEIEKAFDGVSINLQDMDYNIENFKETFSNEINTKIKVNEEYADKQIRDFKTSVNQTVITYQENTEKQITDFENNVNKTVGAMDSRVTTNANNIQKHVDDVNKALHDANESIDAKLSTAESYKNDAKKSADEAKTTYNTIVPAVNSEINRAKSEINTTTTKANNNVTSNANQYIRTFNQYDTEFRKYKEDSKDFYQKAVGWNIQYETDGEEDCLVFEDKTQTEINQAKNYIEDARDKAITSIQTKTTEGVNSINSTKDSATSELTQIANSAKNSITNTKTQAEQNITATKNQAVTEVRNASATNINTATSNGLNEITKAKNSAVLACSEQVALAKEYAQQANGWDFSYQDETLVFTRNEV